MLELVKFLFNKQDIEYIFWRSVGIESSGLPIDSFISKCCSYIVFNKIDSNIRNKIDQLIEIRRVDSTLKRFKYEYNSLKNQITYLDSSEKSINEWKILSLYSMYKGLYTIL